MIFTPTSKSQLAAGAAFWVTIWSVIYELDSIAKPLRLSRWVSRAAVVGWMRQNKVLSFLITELINYGHVDAESPAGVTFAVGGSIVNGCVIFLVLPCSSTLERLINRLCFWRTRIP